jgi:hypothetical protein
MSLSGFHVRPVLRFAWAVDGRPACLTKKAAYRGAVKATVKRRCDCSGSGSREDPTYVCEYHDALLSQGPDASVLRFRQRVMARLERLYKRRDAQTAASLDRPVLDLSHMTKDELEQVLVAVDYHLQHGLYQGMEK